MENDYKGVASFGSEWDVKFCLKCRGMELHRFIDGKWKCGGCKKRNIKNRRRRANENIKA